MYPALLYCMCIIISRYTIIILQSEQLQFHCHEKEQVVLELNHALVELRIEFRAAQEENLDLQGELSLLQQQMTDLRDVSEGKGKRIQQLSDQIDTDKKNVRIYKFLAIMYLSDNKPDVLEYY